MIIAHPQAPDLVGKLNILTKKINPELKLQQSELDEGLINLFKVASKTGEQSITSSRRLTGWEAQVPSEDEIGPLPI